MAIYLDTDRVDAASLAALYAVGLASLAGFTLFGLNPALLNRVPGAAEVYGRMFLIAPRAQIILAFAVLALFLSRRVGARWLPAFGIVYVLSLASELSGTTVGLPFGPYSYSDGLGFKLFGHVPGLIPASWFFMALPSYAIAARRFGEGHGLLRVLFASFILLSWDLSLDPAMSLATRYWLWATEGPYYGMPLLNLFGWYATGLLLMEALRRLRADAWLQGLSIRWMVGYYGANLLLPVGMSAAAGLWGAVIATVVAIAVCGLAARALPERAYA